MNTFKKILFIFDKNKYHILPLSILFIVLSLLEIIGISFLSIFISSLVEKNILSNNFLNNFIEDLPFLEKIILNIKYLSALIIIIFLIKGFATFSINFYIEYFTKKVALEVRRQLVTQFLNDNIHNVYEKNISKYIETIIRLVELFQGPCTSALIKILSDLTILLFISIMIVFSSTPHILFSIIIFFVLGILYVLYFGPKLKKYSKLHSESSKDIIRSTYEMILGVSEIKSYDKQNFFKEKFNAFNKILFINSLKSDLPNLFVRPFFEFLLTVIIVSLCLLFISNGDDSNNNLFQLSLISICLLRVFPIINSLISSQNKFNSSKYAVSEIYSFLKNKDIKKLSDKIQINEFKKIEIKNLSFKYENKKQKIFKDLNFAIKSPDLVGVSGTSGSGKTTLISIILGNLRNFDGEIIINDKYNFKNINLYEWVKIFAYIPQEPYLFNDTIAKNISLEKNFDESKVIECLKMVGMEEFTLKEKMNIYVGDRGTSLSGGQKQRISIARALYHDKKFIILDEPTSQLDKKNTEIILKTINKIKDTKTIIIISHDQKILNNCNFLIKLN